MSDEKDIIDLTTYLDAADSVEDGTFAVFGGGGAGSRFALPLWRSIYLLGGERGAVLAVSGEADALEPVFILDLQSDPARQAFPMPEASLLELFRAGTRVHVDRRGWVAVLLGEKEGKIFYAVVTDMKNSGIMDDLEVRQDFLFLAGECAGLVLHWGLEKAEESDP